ncbi:LysR family transcriptional regulator substrate-binding protein, partial [Nostoc sp. NIES-2111]
MKQLAHQIRRGEIASLRLALSNTVDITLLIPLLSELTRAYPGLELRFSRGTGETVAESLKKGEADLAVAGMLSQSWDRFDVWPLFSEDFALLVGGDHSLADANAVEVEDLAAHKLLARSYCEQVDQIATLLKGRNIPIDNAHAVGAEREMVSVLEAGLGVAIAPRSAALPQTVRRIALRGLPVT